MFMKTPFLGWIALDIDGTVTTDKYKIPPEVVAFLREQVKAGWKIAMATGRPVTFASIALATFDFPYLFLPQNGTAVLQMPEKKCLFKRYFSKSALRKAEIAMEGFSGDFIVYSGYENNDIVYWRPGRFDSEQTRYLHALWHRQRESNVPVKSFEEAPQDAFPLLKCFGMKYEMQRLQKKLQEQQFNVALLQDPFEENYSILLVTDSLASKGQSFEQAVELLGERGAIIAAGDDENDLSLLQIADVAIAMHHAPPALQQIASFIAPPTSELGILHALKLALKSV